MASLLHSSSETESRLPHLSNKIAQASHPSNLRQGQKRASESQMEEAVMPPLYNSLTK